jgi:nitrile hydratase
MNGPHDVGGQMGFGAVAPEPNEPVFHARWEGRALGLNFCSGALGKWNLDISRHVRESIHPADYYASSYYEIWIKGLEALLERYGFVGREDFEAGRAVLPVAPPSRLLRADDIPATIARGSPYNRPLGTVPRFAAGDRIRARNMHPRGHTRLPRYVRGKTGVIETEHGGFVFPDTNAHGKGENPQRLYTVVFTARELWGEDADPTLTVSIDAFEPYLEPA